MKKTVLLFVFIASSIYATAQQPVIADDVYDNYIKGRPAASQLYKALELLSDDCVDGDQFNCDKLKAFTYYKLAEEYYHAAQQVAMVDKGMSLPLVEKAQDLTALAEHIYPASSMDDKLLNSLTRNKDTYYTYIKNN